MSKSSGNGINLGELSNKVYTLLQDLEAEERTKVLTSVAHLFGDPPTLGSPGSTSTQASTPQPKPNFGSQSASGTPQQYFVSKDPKNKGEMLAVAAKYLEDHGSGHLHTREDFEKFFTDARQNFDRKNFARDMKNARNQAHLFNKGTTGGQHQLSYFGQQYVDLLPDREALKKLQRPGRKAAKKKKAKAGASK